LLSKIGIVGWLFDIIMPVIPLPPLVPAPPQPHPQPSPVAGGSVEGDCRVSCVNWPYQQCEVSLHFIILYSFKKKYCFDKKKNNFQKALWENAL
jgi:hypothetical protein